MSRSDALENDQLVVLSRLWEDEPLPDGLDRAARRRIEKAEPWRRGASVAELAREAGLPKGDVEAQLATLAARGFASEAKGGRWHLTEAGREALTQAERAG